jgi:putative heme-binding domain-containing protein
MDAGLAYAFAQAVRTLGPSWHADFKAGRLSFGGSGGRLQAVLSAAGSAELLKPLADRARSGAASPEALRALAAAGGPAELALVLEKTDDPQALEEILARKLKPEGDPAPALRRLLRGERTRRVAVLLAGDWRVESLRDEVAVHAADASLRRPVLETLARLGDPLNVYVSHASPEIRRDAVAALATVDPAKAAPAAPAVFSGDADPGDVVAAFLSRSGGAELLAASLKDAAVGKDAARLALRAMGSAGREDRALWELFQKAAGLDGKPIPHSADLARELAAEAREQGDPVRGERIFRGAVTNCVSCHAIGGAGGRTGPELGEVGTALPPDMLVEAVLWPQRAVKENFTASLLQLDDDRIVQGYRVREDKEALYVRDPASERIDRYPKARVKRQKDVGSLMPEGVVQGLTRQELRDLVRFLMELGRPGPWQVTASPRVRGWEVLARPGPEAAWAFRPATVAGELPLEELRHGRARFAVDLPRASRVRIVLDPREGLEAVLNGTPLGAEPVDLPAGRSVVELRILPGRTSPVRAEVLIN